MKVTVRITRSFRKSAKRLLKKYPSLHQELSELNDDLSANPRQGKTLGHNIYKIRLAVKSKGKGKSGGLRVISYVEVEIIGSIEKDNSVTFVNLIYIYDKSETATITDKEIQEIISGIQE